MSFIYLFIFSTDAIINFIILFIIYFYIITIIVIFINRKNLIQLIIIIELLLLLIVLNFSIISFLENKIFGLIFSIIIMVVAATESAIFLTIIITYYKIRGLISSNLLNILKKFL